MLRHPLHRVILDNGLRTIVVPLSHLHTVTVSLFVGAGSRHEDARTNGLSHVLEHMLFRGTERHPSAHALNLAIERLGGTLYGATQADMTSYQVTVPPANVDAVLALLVEILTTPVFEGLEVEKRVLREEILEELDEDGNDIDADNLVRDLLFSPHPLGFKITGSLDNVQGFTVDDLHDHLRRLYGGRNMVLCLAGAVDEGVLASVRTAFAPLPPGELASVAPPTPAAGGPRFTAVYDEGSQTDVRLSYPSLGLHEPAYPALQMLARVLDDGLSSRLHRRVCDEAGLAYDAFASLETYEDCGVLDLGGSVEHEKTPEMLDALTHLAADLREDLVSADELDKARRRYVWDLTAMLDDASAMASFYGTSALFDLPDTLESTAGVIEMVSAEQVREVARRVFAPERARVACVGVLERARIPEARALIG